MSDRKYRQKGYQDDSSRKARRPSVDRPRHEPDGPRGRGLGGPGRASFRCVRCGAEQPVGGVVALDAACDKCGSELHTCTHCRHFDSAAPNECRLPRSLRIPRKAAANDCAEFDPKQVQVVGGGDDAGGDAQSAFDALFDL